MRERSRTRSSRTALAAATATAAGAALVLLTFLRGGCTDVLCTGDTAAAAVAFESVSLSSWVVRWQEGCNSCTASLTPVLAGVVLLSIGAVWFAGSVLPATATLSGRADE
ncbi:hypothetical protein [Halorubellus litoreus]|uniref:Uncharacterized protein n=1 Tax=Halorubellus litoreus TaxID=755308 RepID=A0ABD5VN89_9EURY